MNNVVDDDVPMPKVSNMRRAPSTVSMTVSESMMPFQEFQEKPRARSFKTLADSDE